MSRANGRCFTINGDRYYFIYNGTNDMCFTRLYYSSEIYDKTSWDFESNEVACTCSEKNHTQCMLSTDYGNPHFLFESEVCEKCLCITGRIFLHEDDQV